MRHPKASGGACSGFYCLTGSRLGQAKANCRRRPRKSARG